MDKQELVRLPASRVLQFAIKQIMDRANDEIAGLIDLAKSEAGIPQVASLEGTEWVFPAPPKEG